MRDWTDLRYLTAWSAGMIVLLLAWELWRHLLVTPLPPAVLLFELAEELLLIGAAVACALLVHRVRMRTTALATLGLVGLLLTGEVYLGEAPATPRSLLHELVEIALLIGYACAISAWCDSPQQIER